MEPRKPTRIIIGASSQGYPGWIRTQQKELDLTNDSQWAARFAPESVDTVLAEHVWEHLDPEDGLTAAQICHRYLRAGGFVRCAVPDGYLPDSAYQQMVQIGGPGPADHPAASHKVVFTAKTLTSLFESAGFEVSLLEWWTEDGRFHTQPWCEQDGFIYRSLRFDHRNRNGQPVFTSLIVDAIKPQGGREDSST